MLLSSITGIHSQFTKKKKNWNNSNNNNILEQIL